MAHMPPLVRLVLTVAFASGGWYCLRRCMGLVAGSTDWLSRVNYAAHLAMSAAMVAMVWTLPRFALWQMTVFALACGWFAVQATGVPLSYASVGLVAGDAPAHPAGWRTTPAHRVRCLHHAAVMAGMVWMLAVMSGMSMASSTKPGAAMSSTMSMPSRVVCGACVAAALALIATSRKAARPNEPNRRSRPRHNAADDIYHALMTAGMGVMVLTTG